MPCNESWGLREIAYNRRQQDLARMLYFTTKATDGTRLCSSNDGWEQVETDICAVHDYTADKEELSLHFANREEMEKQGYTSRMTYADGVCRRDGAPFMMTEYGGIAHDRTGSQSEVGGVKTWGYFGKVRSEEEFLARYGQTTNAIREIPYCHGYCYTQLTDVMQEINGLLTPERTPKAAPERIAGINRDPVGKYGRGRKNAH